MTYSPPAPYGATPPQGQRTSGLSIGALICSIIAFLVAWVPCINVILTPLLALVALILGIIGWIQASKDPTQKPTLAMIAIALAVLAVVAIFISYAIFGKRLMEFGGQQARTELVNEFSRRADATEQQARESGVSDADIKAARDELNAALDKAPADLLKLEQTQRDLEAAFEQFRSRLGLTLPDVDSDDGGG